MKVKKVLGLISIGMGMMTLSACGNFNLNQHSNTKVSSGEKLPSTYFENANQQSQNEAGQSVQIHLMTKSLKNNYKGLFSVHYNEAKNVIQLTPTNKSVKELIKLSKQNNSSAISSWHQFVSGVRKTSVSVSKQVKGNNVKLAIMDPTNSNKMLYTAANGKTLSDVFQN